MLSPAQQYAIAISEQLANNYSKEERRVIFHELAVAGFCLECGDYTPLGACGCLQETKNTESTEETPKDKYHRLTKELNEGMKDAARETNPNLKSKKYIALHRIVRERQDHICKYGIPH